MPVEMKRDRIERLRTLGMAEGGKPPEPPPPPDPVATALSAAAGSVGEIAAAVRTLTEAQQQRPQATRWKFTVTKRDANGRILEMDAQGIDAP
jgi:hypothetical protein